MELDSGVFVIERIRSGRVDSEQQVDAVAVDADERVIGRWGSADDEVITHCCVKPFHAIALLQSGAAAKFSLDDQDIALAAASQGGEEFQREIVHRWINKLQLPECAFTCGTHVPYSPLARKELILTHSAPTIAHYNSIGRHLSLLSICKASGFPIEGYGQRNHPVQQYVWSVASSYFEAEGSKVPEVIELDGTPIPAVRLERLAAAAVRFITQAEVDAIGPCHRIAQAMMRYPAVVTYPMHYLIELQQVLGSKLFVKIGAYSVCMACHTPSRTGIAFKVRDGSELPQMITALVPLLRHLDLFTPAEWNQIKHINERDILTYNGEKVGSTRARFPVQHWF